MSEHIIRPNKSRWEKCRDWSKSWSPQVKQAVIAGAILILLTVAGWILFSPKGKSDELVGEISRTSIYQETNAQIRAVRSRVFLLVSIDNTGPVPTKVDHYSLDIKSGTAQFKSLQPVVIPEEVRLASGDGRELAPATNAIYDKTITPLREGDTKMGWIAFDVPGTSTEALKANGTTFRLRFEDNRRREFFAQYAWSSERTNLLYFPGQ